VFSGGAVILSVARDPRLWRRRRVGSVVVCALAFLAACQPASPGAPTAENTLVRIAWSDVGVPTPFRVSTAGPGGAVLLSLIYDTLTWKDERGIIPWLATSWDISPDGRELTFTLAHNVKWQDGQPLTADDVGFSFDYYAAHPYRWMPTDMVESASVLSAERVLLRLKNPYPPFVEEVAGVVPIIPRHVWQNVADPLHYDAADATLGSGPYRLTEYRSAEAAYRLTAFADYFKGRPRVQEVQQLNLPAETVVQALQQGQVDLAFTSDASVVALLQGNARLKVLQTAPLSVVRLVLNTERPPLDRVTVRQALALALDRAAVARAVTKGDPVVGSAGVIPPETPWFSPGVRQYAFDPDAARGLLGGERLTLELLAQPDAREPELLQPMLEAVGVGLQIKRVDAQTKAQLLKEKRYEVALLQHIGVGGDPDYLRRWYAGREANLFAQGDVLHDPAFDALAQQQATTLDTTARKALVARLQDVLAEDVPTIPLFYRRFYWIFDSTRLTPINTFGGLMNGIPLVYNKLIFLPS
jgi:peptide/nickel transport system substrate-binding protein